MLVLWEEANAGCVGGRWMLVVWKWVDASLMGEADAGCVGVGGCWLCESRWMLVLWGRRMLIVWE
jgi:hypothetical protein